MHIISKLADSYAILADSIMNPNRTYRIKRKNKYEHITDSKRLLAHIDQSPGGLVLDEELLRFTYRGVTIDIEKMVAEGLVYTLELVQKKKDGLLNYIVFPRKYEIYPDKTKLE